MIDHHVAVERLKFLTLIAASAEAARDALARSMALAAKAQSIAPIVAADPGVAGVIHSNGHATHRKVMEATARQSQGDPAAARRQLEGQAMELACQSIAETLNAVNMAAALNTEVPITPQEIALVRGG